MSMTACVRCCQLITIKAVHLVPLAGLGELAAHDGGVQPVDEAHDRGVRGRALERCEVRLAEDVLGRDDISRAPVLLVWCVGHCKWRKMEKDEEGMTKVAT
jgi:hypothetical protein